nr:Maf family protein [Deinobacterium chartae]
MASGSPRRRELLGRIGVRFEVLTAHTSEDTEQRDPAQAVQELALHKARAVRELRPEGRIIAADTVVTVDGDILGKPRDASENLEMLRRLAGREHVVYTGVAVLAGAREISGFEATAVRFRPLSEAELRWYAATGEGLDKAGGYGIQERGMLLVEGITGDYFNVMGLPMVRLLALCRALDLPLVEDLDLPEKGQP